MQEPSSEALPAPAYAPSARPLSANANFRRFWFGQAASTAGDAFAFVAMPLLVLDMTGSVAQMGNVTAIACGAHLAMSLVAGVIVDRSHRRALMIATDVARMALYATIPVAWWLHAPSLCLIYVVAGLGAALGNLFLVGHVTAVANIVARDDLAAANSRLQATQALTYAVGPVLAGAVCARLGPATAIAVDAASFGASALSLVFVRFRSERAEPSADAPRSRGGVDFLAGLRFVLRQPVLRWSTSVQVFVAVLACAGMNAAVIDLFVFRLRHDLGESSRVVGWCLGVAALGALCGALFSPRLRRRFSAGACVLGGTGIQALGLAAAGLLPGVLATLLGAALWATGLTMRAVINVSLRQELTPDALLGRVMAATTMVIFGSATVGAILVTRAAAQLGAAHALALAGGALAVVVAAAWTTPLAQAR